MKIKLVTAIVMLFVTSALMAQEFNLSAEIRPRFESRHGYKTLVINNTKGANFISQRSRLNFGYTNKKVKVYVSLQNVRTWGEASTLSPNDQAFSFHQAWAEGKLSDNVSVKLGRQEIIYDDHRIFGSVGWAQQARSHDAMLFKFNFEKKHRIDLGLALNADNQGLTDQLYSNVAGYKAFQYVWYHGKFDKFGLSFLGLNSGKEYLKDPADPASDQKVDYMQTIGPRLTYKADKLIANAAFYYQGGKMMDNKVNASYISANVGYKMTSNIHLTVGFELLSGKDMDDTSTDLKSFAPLFGTNHKFNGWMDYFYVGNHFNSVGLQDINATMKYTKGKFTLKMMPHFFQSAAKVIDMSGNELSKSLGTEIDMATTYKIQKDFVISAGFSKMFATDTMEALKGGEKDAANQWGWIMFTFKPVLVKTVK